MLRHKPPQDDEPVSGFMPGMSETKKKKGILKLFSRRKSSSFKIQDATYSEPVKKKSGERTLTEQRLAAIEMQLSDPPGNAESATANTQASATNQRPVSQGPPVNQRVSHGPPKERPISGGPPVNQRQKARAPSSPVSSSTSTVPRVEITRASSGSWSSQGSPDWQPSPGSPVQTSTPGSAKTLNNNHPLSQYKVPQKAPRKKRLAPPPPPQPPITSNSDNASAISKEAVSVSSPVAPQVEPKTTRIEVTNVTTEPDKIEHWESDESSVEQVTVVQTKTTVRSESMSEVPSVSKETHTEVKTEIKTLPTGKSDTLKRRRKAPAPPAPSPTAAAAAGSTSESPPGAGPASSQTRTSAPQPPALNLSLSSSSSQSDTHESEKDVQSPAFTTQVESSTFRVESDAVQAENAEQDGDRPLPQFVAPPPPVSPPPPLSPASKDFEDLRNTSREDMVSPEQTGPAVTTIIITDSPARESPPSPEIRTNAVTEFKADAELQINAKGKSSKAKMDGRDSDSESSSDTSSVMAYDVNLSMDEPPVPGVDDGVILTGKRVFEETSMEISEMSSPTFDDHATSGPPDQTLPSPVPPLDTQLDSSEIIFDNLDVIYVSPEERTLLTSTDESSTDPIESPTSIGDQDRDDVFDRSGIAVTRTKQDDSAYASFSNGNTTIYPSKEVQNKPKQDRPMVTNLRQLYHNKPPSRTSEPASPSPAYDFGYNSQGENSRTEEHYPWSPEAPSMSSESSVSPDPVREGTYESTTFTKTWQMNEEDAREPEVSSMSFQAPNLPASPPPPPPPSGLGGSALHDRDIDVNNVWELIEEKKILPVDSQRVDTSDTYKENQGDSYNINVGSVDVTPPREYETNTYTETRSITSPSWNQTPEKSPSLQDQKIREETRRWSALVGPQGYMKQHQAFSFAHPETENESLLEEKSVSLLRSPGQDSHDDVLKERYDDLQKKFYSWEQQLKENQALITKKVMTKTEADKQRSNRDIEVTPAPFVSSSVPIPPAPPPVAPPPVAPFTSTPRAPASRGSRLHSAPEPSRQDSSSGLAGRFSPGELLQAKANLRNSQVSEFDSSIGNTTRYTSPRNTSSTPRTSHTQPSSSINNEPSSLKKKTTANGSAFRGTPRSQSVSSSRFEIKMDPREELMIAIRNAGGRGALQRVNRR